MKVLLMGMGLQGKAVVHDLEKSDLIKEILVLDNDLEAVNAYIAAKGFQKTVAEKLDASSESDLRKSVSQSNADLVITMLPVEFGPQVAKAALDAGIHFVSASYTGEIGKLDTEAREKGIIMLPEMGMDPGIDLVLGGVAVSMLDRVHGLYSYGAGIPEPAHMDDNPLRYKISWSFEGVLRAYHRDAVIIKDGRTIAIPGDSIFKPEHTHMVDVPELGLMEAYPNGNATNFLSVFGLDESIRHMGRFAMRWPGHCAFWGTIAGLGLLSDQADDSISISPRDFLVHTISPKLRYADNEKDIIVIRVEAWGEKDGQGKRVTFEVIDSRDLETGLFAMNRTVGFTAAIAARMILSGKITTPGVLSPPKDVPADDFFGELELVGIRTRHRVEDIDPHQYTPASMPVA